MWHLLTLGAMATCGWLAAWQWQRAGSAMGSALNVGYGLQWPLFAVFFGMMWWRMLRMELRELGGAGEPREVSDAPVGTSLGPPVSVVAAPHPALDPVRPSPFGSRPRVVTLPVTDEDDPELAAYNRMLARLAARDTKG